MGPVGRGRDVAPARTRCAPSFPGIATSPERLVPPPQMAAPSKGYPHCWD